MCNTANGGDMPVFAKDGKFILFIHVPKTGGSFIEDFFHQNGYALGLINQGKQSPNFNAIFRTSPQHMHAEQIRLMLDMDRIDHIFMAVRHPVKRLLSEYTMRLDPEAPEDFNDWFDAIYEEYQTNPFVSDNHIRPQWEFEVEGARIFRQEDGFGGKWAATLEREFGLSFPKKFFWRSGASLHKRQFACGTDTITQENKDKILALYARDFKQYGYEPIFQ